MMRDMEPTCPFLLADSQLTARYVREDVLGHPATTWPQAHERLSEPTQTARTIQLITKLWAKWKAGVSAAKFWGSWLIRGSRRVWAVAPNHWLRWASGPEQEAGCLVHRNLQWWLSDHGVPELKYTGSLGKSYLICMPQILICPIFISVIQIFSNFLCSFFSDSWVIWKCIV